MFRLPSWKLTYPPEKSILKMMFRFPFGGICIRSLEGIVQMVRGEKFSTTQLPSILRDCKGVKLESLDQQVGVDAIKAGGTWGGL